MNNYASLPSKNIQNPLIAVGTTNEVKVQAVEEVLGEYSIFACARIRAYSVPSEISEQPLSLEEIIQGAKNRAKNAYLACNSCNFSLGIESGLFEAVGTHTGFLETCICCIFDGSHYYIGMSCGYEVPPKILNIVLEKQMDLGQACYESGITEHLKLGSKEGLIGMLTKGRITRKDYTKQCIKTALIQLENTDWYSEMIINEYKGVYRK